MNFYLAENALRTRDLLNNLQSRLEFQNEPYGKAYVAGVCKAYADLTPGDQSYLSCFAAERVRKLEASENNMKGFYAGYLSMASAVCYDACSSLCPPSFESAKARLEEYFVNPINEDFSFEGGMEDDDGVTRVFNGGLCERMKAREERFFKIEVEAQILPKYLC